MKLTSTEIVKAIKISQCLQEYFDKYLQEGEIRSTDAFEILQKKGLVPWDRHRGMHLRRFLHQLFYARALYLIPQCRYVVHKKYVHWFFASAPSKTLKNRKLRPLRKVVRQP